MFFSGCLAQCCRIAVFWTRNEYYSNHSYKRFGWVSFILMIDENNQCYLPCSFLEITDKLQCFMQKLMLVCRVIQNIADSRPKVRYLVAVDDSKNTLEEIVKVGSFYLQMISKCWCLYRHFLKFPLEIII